jgi:hypothetical protein
MRFSPEAELIVKVLRSFLGKKNPDLAQNSRWDCLDWNKILSIGRHQNLLPLFSHVLSRQGVWKRIPPWVREEFEEESLDNTVIALLYDVLSEEVLTFFHQKKSLS